MTFDPAARIAVSYRPVAALRPDPRNPRRHDRRQVKQIAASIAAFGFNVPILVDATSAVIAGHGRLLAAKQLGWTEVPTITLEHLSEAQATAFMVADNRLTDTSTWDDALLGGLLQDLAALELDFDLEAIGFSMGEIDLRIEGLGTQPEDSPDPADDLPPVGPSVSRPGDLWLLGPHRLLCGDARDLAAFDTLMAGETAAMVFTDPPYNVVIDGHAGGKGAIRHREFAMASGEMDEAQFTAFLATVCRHLAAHSADGSLHYLFMDWRHLGELLEAGRAAYTELKNLCVWAKDWPGMGSLYRSQHELVFVFKAGRGRHRNNVELGRFGRNRSNLWAYPGIATLRHGEEGDLLALHPTVKPVNLVADAIMDCSARGDIALDPFLGIGTTLIAAERTGRRCFGMEIDPLYLDTAIRRWQAWTGEAVRQASGGKSFDDLAAEVSDGR